MRLPRLRLRLIAAASAATAALALVPAAAVAEPATPFYPGYIISDDSFFNPDAMTAGQIQEFLEDRTCHPKDGVPCLADFRMNTPAQPASAERCMAIPARKKEAASSIIARVAAACTVSPRVLLVLLQKEQSLLTAPSTDGYQRATGYACPDTADCDARYFGFFNQVYRAAWQFREYTVHPGDWRYKVGGNSIQYHPKATCGSSEVTILNQATANLYNYTPYQPNDDTLKHPAGPGGDCSAYGNLNFSRLYSAWFGSPLAVRYPGFVDGCLVYRDGFGCRTGTPLRP